METTDRKLLFPLGQLVATPGALALIVELGEGNADTLGDCIKRHASGDWGDVCEEDRGLNDQSLKDGTRLVSVYKVRGEDDSEHTLWIITEWDRSVTTVLLPEEY